MKRLHVLDPAVKSWLNTRISLSRGDSWASGTTGDPVPEQWGIGDLLEYLVAHVPAANKHAVRYFTPGLFGPLAKRRKKLGRDAQIIAFDFDGKDKRGVPLRWLVKKLHELRRQGIAYVLHTSHSHGTKAAPLHFRGRIVLFPATPIKNADEYRCVWEFWAEFFDHECDPSPKAINSVFYPPTRPRDDHRFYGRAFAGLPFDTNECQTEPPRPSGSTSSYPPVDVSSVPHTERVEAALRELNGMPPAVEGASGRHQTMLAVLVGHDYGIEWRVWCEVVAQSDWNRACLPPWTLGDLLGHFRGVYDSAEGAFGAKCTAPFSITVLNSEKCSVDRAAVEVKNAQVTLLGGPMASGKTTIALNESKNHKRAIFQAQTRALVLSTAGRAGIATYDQDREAAHVAVTQASLLSLPGSGSERGGFFCVDEYLHDLSFLHSGCTPDAVRTFREVHRRLAFATCGIVMAAGLNRWLRNFCKKAILRENPDANIQDLEIDAPQLDRQLVFMPAVEDARDDFFQALVNRKGRLVVITDTIEEAERIREEIARMVRFNFIPPVSVSVVHGEEDRSQMRDPDKLARSCDVLIMNHAASHGVSFQEPFWRVYALFTNRGALTGEERCQMIARFRNVEDKAVIVGMKNWRPGRREEDHRKIIDRAKKRGAAVSKVSPVELVDDDLFFSAWVWMQVGRAKAYNRPRTDLEFHAKAMGWVVLAGVTDAPHTDMAEAGRRVKRARIDALCEAPDIDDDEAYRIDVNPHRTKGEIWALKKFKIRRRYGWFDRTLAELDHKDRHWERVKNYELARLSLTHPGFVKRRDLGKKHVTQVKSDYHRSMLMQKMVRDVLGIQIGEAVQRDADEIRDLYVRFVRENREALSTFFPSDTFSVRNGAVLSFMAKIRRFGAEVSSRVNSDNVRSYDVSWISDAYGRLFRESLGVREESVAA